MATIEQTGPGLLTRVCAEFVSDAGVTVNGAREATIDNDGVLLLPQQWFYPLPNVPSGGEERREQQASSLVVPGATHAVHHWARSWCP